MPTSVRRYSFRAENDQHFVAQPHLELLRRLIADDGLASAGSCVSIQRPWTSG